MKDVQSVDIQIVLKMTKTLQNLRISDPLCVW